MFISTALQGFNSNHFTQLRDNQRYPTFSQVQAFTQAGSVTRVVLPDYVNMIRVYAWGGGGGGGERNFAPPVSIATIPDWGGGSGFYGSRQGGPGGDGGFVQADVPIQPGTVLYVRVAEGGTGSMPVSFGANTNPGRTIVSRSGGVGGGYTSVELPASYPVPMRYLVVAGGGGGGGAAPDVNSDPFYNAPAFAPVPQQPNPYRHGGRGGPANSPSPAPGGGPPSGGGSSGTANSGGTGQNWTVASMPTTPGFFPTTPGTVYAANGSFLQGGGNTSPTFYRVKHGGAAISNIPLSRAFFFPGPAQWIEITNGGGSGGGGFYGGGAGAGAPPLFINAGQYFGSAGGGGGSSYVNPEASNISMANTTAGYNTNPYIVEYNPVVANLNVGSDTLSIGIGGQAYPYKSNRTPTNPAPTQNTNPNPFSFIDNAPYLIPTSTMSGSDPGAFGRTGGQGLVVIVY